MLLFMPEEICCNGIHCMIQTANQQGVAHMETVIEKIKTLATLENALAYEKEQNQYIFAEVMIESELGIKGTEARVHLLEDFFFDIIAAHKAGVEKI